MNDRFDLLVKIGGDDVDTAESADLGWRLREELLTLDVDDVRSLSAGPPPAGAKAAEAIALGALVVSLAPATIGRLMDVLVSWLGRQQIAVVVEIDGHKLTGPMTREQRDALVSTFLARAAGPTRP